MPVANIEALVRLTTAARTHVAINVQSLGRRQ
jgi:hypothetical protein